MKLSPNSAPPSKTSLGWILLVALLALAGCEGDTGAGPAGGDVPTGDDAGNNTSDDVASEDTTLDDTGAEPQDQGGDGQPDSSLSDSGNIEVDQAVIDTTGDDTSTAGDVVVDLGSPPPDDTSALLIPRFELVREGFYDFPWPSDTRLFEDGYVDLTDFPNRRISIVDRFADNIEEFVRGFSTMPIIYFGFDKLPTSADIPTPVESLETTSTIQLIDVSVEGCGQRVPILPELWPEADEYRDGNLLQIRLVPGFPLLPTRTYAAVILKAFGEESDMSTWPAYGIGALLDGSHPDAVAAAAFAPLRNCLPQTGLAAGDIAVATVFTVDDPTEEVIRIREMVLDPDAVADPVVANWGLDSDHTQPAKYTTYTGTYETPIFQRGESPYPYGGGFIFDEDGVPVIQRWETVPFSVALPKGDGPFSLVIWQGGTGASPFGHLTGQPGKDLLAEGLALANFTPQFHGDRAVPGSDPVLHSFNFLNPESGRAVFRQQLVDTSYFVRLLQNVLPDLDGMDVVQTHELVYASHSQGSLVGVMLAGVETEIDAYMMNGTGGYITGTVLYRKDYEDIEALLRSLISATEVLDLYHPVVQMVQLGADVVDPFNYVHTFAGWEENSDGSSIFVINGEMDATTPTILVNMLTIAGDLEPLLFEGWDVDPYGLWDVEPTGLPVGGNRTAYDGSRITLITELHAETGHHTINDVPAARARAVEFIHNAFLTTFPVLLP